MTPRTLGAGIGVLVALGCSAYIVIRLVEAGAPAPTALRLVNGSSAPVVVRALGLDAQPLLASPLELPAARTGEPPAATVTKELPFAPGRPIAVSARIGDGAHAAACQLEPRPHGTCTVNAVYDGGTTLRCDYDCTKPRGAE